MARIQRSVGRGGRNIGDDVITVQNLLNRHRLQLVPLVALDVDGKCGKKTIQAIERFQINVVRLNSADGRVDPGGRTIRALSSSPQQAAVQLYHYPAGPQEPLADIAEPYVGASEARGNRMGTDPRMREIFEADWLEKDGQTDGYPWCCAFVSMCTQKLLSQHRAFYDHLTPPRTAGVTSFRTRWAPRNRCLVFPPNDLDTRPHKGDVVVFTFSHIGIVREVRADGVMTIEGNTNEAGSREGTTVRRDKHRKWNRIRCFIRFPIPITYDTTNEMCRPLAASQV